VVSTAHGVVTPVGVEQRVERLPGVRAAAVAGIGPVGTQVVAVVVVPVTAASRRGGSQLQLAEHSLAEQVRAAAGTEVAAVLTTSRLPLDIRHASKVDRQEVAARAGRFLRGARRS
jgi:hypothetical protein